MSAPTEFGGAGKAWGLRESHSFDRHTIRYIQEAARTGLYRIQGFRRQTQGSEF